MEERAALLMTDIVDSTAITANLGDAASAALWGVHDRLARDLLHAWRGREIDKSDGFFLLFAGAADALGYALAYHRALATLDTPLSARAGLHVCSVHTRLTPAADVARGAKPLEVDGVGKAVAARVSAVAGGGQTLMTVEARDALAAVPLRVVSHGHWRLKGVDLPIELFEVGEDRAPFAPPPDGEKSYRVVREGEHWLPLREIRHTLPAERDAFVGREDDLRALDRHFDAGARVVSVLGIGGTGKTRLALRHGWRRLGDHPGGVWFCDLSSAHSLDGLLNAVGNGLELALSEQDPVRQIGAAIAGRGRCLVIVDNFEQVARLAEGTLGHWLDRAPRARFLVTTREVLGIAGEEALALAPLAVDDGVRLFERRAEAVSPRSLAQAEDRAAIVPLVRLLDGLPLAIELAAARVRLMTPRTLLARMGERFRLLASSGGRQDRQSTLRAAFDWSWDLLSAADRATLAQLAVFEGGFSLAAAEAVVDLDSLPEAPWVVDTLQSLVDKSLVRSLGDDRFDLLVTLQAYAAEHLRGANRFPGSGPDAEEAARCRHAHHFALMGPERAVRDARADLENFVEACRGSVRRGAADDAAGALQGAWAILALCGPFGTGLELARQVCDLGGMEGGCRARALWVRADASEATGRTTQARDDYAEALALAEGAGDWTTISRIRTGQGRIASREGRKAHAAADQEAALQAARRGGSAACECAALNGLGNLAVDQGRLLEARALYERALAIAVGTGDIRWEGGLRGNLGGVCADMGSMEDALAHYTAALDIARALGDRHREGNTLCNVGLLHWLRGRAAEAVVALEEARRAGADLGHARLQTIVLCNLGLAYESQSRLPQALDALDEAVTLATDLNDRRTQGQALGYRARVLARLGRSDEAHASLNEGRDLLRAIDDPLSLGVLLCCGVEVELYAGRRDLAEQSCSEAATIAEAAGAGADSELGQAVQRSRALLAGVG